MKQTGRAALLLAAAAFFAAGDPSVDMPTLPISHAEAAATQQWTWISSDANWGKFYAPSNVHVKSNVNGVATCISAWIKTAYTAAGAKDTIDAYKIQGSIPDPKMLSYSLAEVEVIPQERKLFYIKENFYDANGKILWSHVFEPPKEREINSQSFDEDYYVALVDQVFHYGERAQKDASDRWRRLWMISTPDGTTTEAMADFTTMRLSGDNLIYWEWQETKTKDGKVQEVKFMKKALNYGQGTEKVISATMWTPEKAWTAMETDGRYAAIPEGSTAYPGLQRLRAIVKGFQYWLNRYRTDLPQTANAKKTQQAQSAAK